MIPLLFRERVKAPDAFFIQRRSATVDTYYKHFLIESKCEPTILIINELGKKVNKKQRDLIKLRILKRLQFSF